jgi:hypothetical protein
MAQSTAVYVYGLVRAARRPAATRIPDPLPYATPVELTAAGSALYVVTSRVPLDVYGPEQLEPRLRDLDWVADVAVAHERVVQQLAGRAGATVVPMKMFTMFSTLEKALADVTGRRRAIDRAIARVAGCEEWGIRITKTTGMAPAVRTDGHPARRVASGRAFLAARKEARDAAAASKEAARRAAAVTFARLERLARDARRRDERSEPGTNPPILEAAFLVRATARGRFRAEARRQAVACATAGAALVLTGPWAPYNFVGAEERA